ncbi:hypothetical protein HDU91_005693 [Kappamyces sp. JEL0680]|nr:hypothetical protein HDU91_005693 [Kappamyces sp. JEL0680]
MILHTALAFLLLAFLLGLCLFQKHSKPASASKAEKRPLLQPGSRTRTSDSRRIQFHSIKSGLGTTRYACNLTDRSKPIIVFLHGFTGSASNWKPILQKLECSYFNYVAFDMLGHGQSSMPPAGLEFTNELIAQQLDHLLQALLPDRSPQVLLVGHSQGGAFAAHYAVSHPSTVKGIVLITPGGIDFSTQDLYHSPSHLFARGLYHAGASRLTQSMAIYASGLALSGVRWLWRSFNQTFMDLVDTLDALYETRGKGRVYNDSFGEYLDNYYSFTDEATKRKRYHEMIGSMLTHLDLLRDRSDLYDELGKLGIPIDLVLAEHDFLVTLQAGKRLHDRLHASSQDHLGLADSTAVEGGRHTAARQLVLSHVLDGTHFLPVEQSESLAQIVIDSFHNVLSTSVTI